MNQKEIWLVNLEPTLGAEIKKTRPCVILNNDAIGVLPLKIVAPITDYKSRYANANWMIKLTPNSKNGLQKISIIDLFQMRSVSEERLVKKIGEISDDELAVCIEAIKMMFEN